MLPTLFTICANGITSVGLAESIRESWEQDINSNGGGAFQRYYRSTYYKPDTSDFSNTAMMSAYMPGQRMGAEEDGQVDHPFIAGQTALSRRNYYSTKFIPMASLTRSGGGGSAAYVGGGSGFTPFSDGQSVPATDLGEIQFSNPIDTGVSLPEFDDLRH